MTHSHCSSSGVRGRRFFRGETSGLRCYSIRIRMGPPLTVAKRPYREETSMKELIRQYLDDGMSRRQLMTGLSALGMSTVAANAMAQSLSPASAAPPGATRDVQGTGGALFVGQLKTPGAQDQFFNPLTGRPSNFLQPGD